MGTSPSIAAPAATPIAVGDLIAKMSCEDKEKSLFEMIKAFEQSGKGICIVVDEANLALPISDTTKAECSSARSSPFHIALKLVV